MKLIQWLSFPHFRTIEWMRMKQDAAVFFVFLASCAHALNRAGHANIFTIHTDWYFILLFDAPPAGDVIHGWLIESDRRWPWERWQEEPPLTEPHAKGSRGKLKSRAEKWKVEMWYRSCRGSERAKGTYVVWIPFDQNQTINVIDPSAVIATHQAPLDLFDGRKIKRITVLLLKPINLLLLFNKSMPESFPIRMKKRPNTGRKRTFPQWIAIASQKVNLFDWSKTLKIRTQYHFLPAAILSIPLTKQKSF